MSKKEIKTDSKKEKEQDTEKKIVTKYDLKVQRREEAKAKAKRERIVSNIVGIAVVVVLACVVASFPIRSYLAVNETYARVNGENISRVEFEYNYNVMLNSYINDYGSYLSLLGLDLSGDLSKQMYSDELSFEDYFNQMAISNIINNKALAAEAQAAGFVYDTSEDYADFEKSLRNAASEAGYTVKDFVRENYGDYATLSRISGYIKEAIYTSAYYDSIMDTRMPTDEDAEIYYNDHKNDFDSVDFRYLTVAAELSEDPTEEETAQAMAAAKEEAEEAEKTVAEEGELNENLTADYVPYLLKEWLFDSAREPGDTAVIENTSGNYYYVVEFEDRYRDNTPTVDIRAVLTAEDNGQAILDEWAAGAATEESFAEICDKYNDSAEISAAGGLLENVQPANMPEELTEWLTDSARKEGDTTVISPADEDYTYVFYYARENDPWWMASAKNILLSEVMNTYMEEITADISVEDLKGVYITSIADETTNDNTGDSENETGSAAQ